MRGPGPGCLAGFILLGSVLSVPGKTSGTEPLTLSAVHLVGTNRLSTEDVIRGLNLQLGVPTTLEQVLQTCDRFQKLKLFDSSHCSYHVEGRSLSLTISVEDKWPGDPVVFDNFVWMTRQELLARLKHDLPLFMPNLPLHTGLTSDIIRVLEQVAAGHGIKAPVRYSQYWTERAMNVFYLDGISTPVRSLEIEGENPAPADEMLKWSNFYETQDYSAPMLTRLIIHILDDLYHSRGYLRAAAGEAIIQPLPEKDGAYPVRIILPISSGPLFTFQSVKFEGLAKEHSASLHAKWKLKPGDPYDTKYVAKFIFGEMLSTSWAQHSGRETDVASPCAKIEEGSRTVSLTITVGAPKKSHTYHPGKGDYECGGEYMKLDISPLP
jgi:outer membrane protein assembly factor BamA